MLQPLDISTDIEASFYLQMNELQQEKKKKESSSKTELGRLLSQGPAEKKRSVLYRSLTDYLTCINALSVIWSHAKL